MGRGGAVALKMGPPVASDFQNLPHDPVTASSTAPL